MKRVHSKLLWYCFLCEWTTQVDNIIVCKTNRHASNNRKFYNCEFMAQTTDDYVECARLHFCVSLNKCQCTVELKSFYRTAINVARTKKDTIEPKKGTNKTRKTTKSIKNQENEQINLSSDSNESPLRATQGKRQNNNNPKKSSMLAQNKRGNQQNCKQKFCKCYIDLFFFYIFFSKTKRCTKS